MEQPKAIHFANLDVLRAIAVFMIVFKHGFESWVTWVGYPNFLRGKDFQDSNIIGDYFRRFFGNLALGVDLFFIISGFLITYLLLIEKQKFNRIDIKKFYFRRILRIWPLYFLIVIISPFLVSLFNYKSPDYFSIIFFYNNFSTMLSHEWIYPFGHFWSVSIEEHFYLIWPVLLAIIPTKRLPLLMIGLIALSIFSRVYFFYKYDGISLFYHLYLHTISRMDYLVVGAFIAYKHFQKPIKFNLNNKIIIVIYLLFFCLLITFLNNWTNSVFSAAFTKYIFGTFIIFIFLNLMFNHVKIFKLKDKSFIHYLGKISYGIYIYHNMLFPFIFTYVINRFTIHSMPLFWFLYLTSTILIATISYEFFEKRILKFKDKFAIIKTIR